MVVLHFERMDEVTPSSVCLTGEGVFRRSIKPRAMGEIKSKQLEQVRHVPCAWHNPLQFLHTMIITDLAGMHILHSPLSFLISEEEDRPLWSRSHKEVVNFL